MKIRHGILGICILATTIFGLLIPDAKGFRDGYLARILVTHVPCAFAASILLVASAWYGFKSLKSKDSKFDDRLIATVEVGTIFAGLTLATGVIFSKVQWGDWWQNDPRQISFLMVFLFYIALLALRSGFSDPSQKEKVSAAMAMALLVPMLFLTFVFPRLPQVISWSFHPTNTISKGLLDGPYSIALWSSVAVMFWLAYEVSHYRVTIAQILRNSYNHETNSSHSTSPRLARPVNVRPSPPQDQPKNKLDSDI